MSIPIQSVIPFEVIHLDYGEIVKKKGLNDETQSFILIIDEATRYLYGPAINQDSRNLMNYLKSLNFFKMVKEVVTDCGPSFSSKIFDSFLENLKITHRKSAPYHPAGNGLIERKIRDVKKYFSCYKDSKKWKENLEAAIRHENRSLNQFLGCSPSFALNRKFPYTIIDRLYGADKCSLKEIEKPVTSKLKYRQLMKKNFDSKHCKKMPNIRIGDWILVQTGFQGKHPLVRGPFKVSNIIQHLDIIKDLFYIDDDGNEKVANIINVSSYHHRSDVQFKWGNVKYPFSNVNISC